MLFAAKKNSNNTWDVIPLSGTLAGETIAVCDGLDMAEVTLDTNRVTGVIRAVWGALIGTDALHDDTETLRALGLGNSFVSEAGMLLKETPQGFADHAGRLQKSARRVTIMNANVYRRC